MLFVEFNESSCNPTQKLSRPRNFPAPKFARPEPHYPALAASGRQSGPANSQRILLEEKSDMVCVLEP
jgi:hypothetical protein